MAEITITLPDGTKQKHEKGTSALQIAEKIGSRLARAAVVAKVNGEMLDLTRPIDQDANIEIITFDSKEGKEVFWHSSAHILAQAVKRLFPKAKPTIGPPIEQGFYYDFANLQLTEEDLTKLEAEMKKIAKEDHQVSRIDHPSKQDASKVYKENPYKKEIIEQADESLSSYKQGEFTDLCRGPHLPSTGRLKAVMLTKIAGAYWRGDADNEQLTRIYGITAPDKKYIKEYKKMMEEAARRDHRKLGAEMELFTSHEEVGPGLTFWLPKGNIIKEELEKLAKETEKEWGYQRVTTPTITKEQLFYTSEHLPHYTESMFSPMDIDGEKYYIKPMNCPFHHLIFKSRTRSYRELPLRVAEYGRCHRYEQSGALFGLMRVRAMDMNDAHIYCTKEQAVKEFVDVLKLHQHYFELLGIEEYWMDLALRDPESDKYHGDEEMWNEAEDLMRQAMDESGIPYTEDIGGAAFYGPKMDFQIKSAIGREFTMSTNQIDLFMPGKFGLKYTGEDGEEHTPVCIHRAPLGTHERFIGFLIENFAGRFPMWLAPEQVAILPISEEQEGHATKMHEELLSADVRSVMLTGDTLNKRIRDAQLRRIPAILVIGDKEIEAGTVALRNLEGKTEYGVKFDEFKKRVREAIDERKLDF